MENPIELKPLEPLEQTKPDEPQTPELSEETAKKHKGLTLGKVIAIFAIILIIAFAAGIVIYSQSGERLKGQFVMPATDLAGIQQQPLLQDLHQAAIQEPLLIDDSAYIPAITQEEAPLTSQLSQEDALKDVLNTFASNCEQYKAELDYAYYNNDWQGTEKSYAASLTALRNNNCLPECDLYFYDAVLQLHEGNYRMDWTFDPMNPSQMPLAAKPDIINILSKCTTDKCEKLVDLYAFFVGRSKSKDMYLPADSQMMHYLIDSNIDTCQVCLELENPVFNASKYFTRTFESLLDNVRATYGNLYYTFDIDKDILLREPEIIIPRTMEQDVLQQDVLQQDVLQQDVLQQDVLQQDVLRQGTFQQDVLQQDVLQQDASFQTAPIFSGPQGFIPVAYAVDTFTDTGIRDTIILDLSGLDAATAVTQDIQSYLEGKCPEPVAVPQCDEIYFVDPADLSVRINSVEAVYGQKIENMSLLVDASGLSGDTRYEFLTDTPTNTALQFSDNTKIGNPLVTDASSVTFFSTEDVTASDMIHVRVIDEKNNTVKLCKDIISLLVSAAPPDEEILPAEAPETITPEPETTTTTTTTTTTPTTTTTTPTTTTTTTTTPTTAPATTTAAPTAPTTTTPTTTVTPATTAPAALAGVPVETEPVVEAEPLIAEVRPAALDRPGRPVAAVHPGAEKQPDATEEVMAPRIPEDGPGVLVYFLGAGIGGLLLSKRKKQK